MTTKHAITYLKDYKAADFLIERVDLYFDIFFEDVIVKSNLLFLFTRYHLL